MAMLLSSLLLLAPSSCTRAKPTCRIHRYLPCLPYTSCAEHIGGVRVPSACGFTNSASAETLGIYGISFACSTETIAICCIHFLYTHCPKSNDVHGLVRFTTEHPCPKPNDVHDLMRLPTEHPCPTPIMTSMVQCV